MKLMEPAPTTVHRWQQEAIRQTFPNEKLRKCSPYPRRTVLVEQRVEIALDH